ncbi:TPA: hypothetical protein QDC27_002897 [Burkholderia cepacia ATCC 25416]|uniref:hypothetical protein n=1 Tax=Burkholderia cepacia TaxID=292 RepID=UPI001CF5484F|nr:hypothetical protein [Burkholderia cepacia]HDR9766441.1 hypothetical protein [Burkholderia cepacia ATCC 25416]MCA8078898.1 hypothetical protein [Burkholderia cepacia]HDR9775105.1 hypothetical protein [Burkholderia cepacia ATCC 25416]HDR9782805.1 hypothetical protein [Burkholderia cepacia ATCC 25416]HDR9790297.1 hypothetical protein [Burkholderia cepacia ATCC 25416]
MTIANAGPSVQDVHAVFDVLGPAFAHGRIARVGDAARTPRPHPASGKSKALAAPATLAPALPADARDVAPRTASQRPPRPRLHAARDRSRLRPQPPHMNPHALRPLCAARKARLRAGRILLLSIDQ